MRCIAVAMGLLFGCGRIAFDDGSSGATGRIEITPPLTISDPGTSVGCPAIVSSGDGWGVAWLADNAVYFARVDADGVRQGGAVRVAMGSNVSSAECPVLAWSGSEYAIAAAIQDEFSAYLSVHTYDAAGALVRSSLVGETTNGPTLAPSIAWTGSGFHLAWLDNYRSTHLTVVPLDRTGAPTGPSLVLSTVDTAFPTVIGTSSGSTAAWSSSEANLVRFAALDGGAVAPGTPIATPARVSDRVAGTWTGSKLGLAWLTDPFHLWFSLVDPNAGSATAPRETVETTGQKTPVIASYPGGFGLVLTYPLSVPSLTFALRDDAGAPAGEATPLADRGSRPSIASGADRFAVAYDDADRIQLVFVTP